MRRPAPALPISPQLLKHFAAATLAITTCVAIFADGRSTQAIAETVKKNELKKTEVDLLGSRKLAQQGLKVRNSPPPPEDPPVQDIEAVDNSSWVGPNQPPAYNSPEAAAGMGMTAYQSPAAAVAPGSANKAGQPRRLTRSEQAKLLESSRRRTGSASVD